MYNIKFCNCQQAQVVYIFKNVKEKLMKTNAVIWLNEILKKFLRDRLDSFHPVVYM